MSAVLVTSIIEAKELIFEKLKTDFSEELEVTLLDFGDISEYETDHSKGALIIHYDGSRFSDSKSQSVTYQDRVFRVAIFHQVRIEHGKNYLDELVDRVILSVAGLKIKSIAKTDRTRMQEDLYLASKPQEQKKFNEHTSVCLIPAEFRQAQENI